MLNQRKPHQFTHPAVAPGHADQASSWVDGVLIPPPFIGMGRVLR